MKLSIIIWVSTYGVLPVYVYYEDGGKSLVAQTRKFYIHQLLTIATLYKLEWNGYFLVISQQKLSDVFIMIDDRMNDLLF